MYRDLSAATRSMSSIAQSGTPISPARWVVPPLVITSLCAVRCDGDSPVRAAGQRAGSPLRLQRSNASEIATLDDGAVKALRGLCELASI
jgi:hypothetical protein